MKFIREAIGTGIAASTDVAIGIIIVHLVGKVFSYDVPLYFYPIGAFLSLLPDIDYIWAKLKRETGTGHRTHRKIPHYPIVMIGLLWVVLGISSIFWPTLFYWAITGSVCLFGHYVHDSIGSELGVEWLAPFRHKSYMFWPLGVLTEEEVNSKRLIDSREAIVKIFLRPTPEAIISILIFTGAILLVLLW